MRIVAGLIVVIIVGSILTAAYTLYPAQPEVEELNRIKSSCLKCHATRLMGGKEKAHLYHRFLECSACHNAPTGSQKTGLVDPASCARCHSVPRYSNSEQVHDAHSAAVCSVCHTGNPSLEKATGVYADIRTAGIILVALGLAGLAVNYLTVRIRMKKKGVKPDA